MILSRHMLPATIVTGLSAVRRDEAIRELARAIDPRGVSDDDRIHSTVLDRGVAIARIETGAAEPGEPFSGESKPIAIGVGLSRRGVDFDSFDGTPVRILFLIAAEHHDVSRYVETLSAIFALIADPGFEARILAAETPQAALEVIRSLEPGRKAEEPAAALCSTTASIE